MRPITRALAAAVLPALLCAAGGCERSYVGAVDAAASDGALPDAVAPPDGALPDGAAPDAATPPDAAATDGALPDGGPGRDGGAVEVCNGLDDDGDGLVDEGLESFCGACGRPYDTAVVAPYPIEGTWMFGRDNACDWQEALEAFHRQGGSWVWQFGPAFQVRTAAEIRSDPDFASCSQSGTHCVNAALADLTAANPSNQVANWLTYHFGDAFSDGILACPSLDRKIVVGNRTYWRIVLPHSANQAPCDFSGGSFDVLFVWHEGPDTKTPLLRAADGLSMHVLLGMPKAPPVAGQAWNVETSLRPAFLEWARRVLEDYALRHGGHPSFAGVYQSFEAPLVASGLNAVYDTYGALAPIVHTALPGKQFALSPYWDVNVDQGDATVASVKGGFKRLARLGVDVIAPQDGRGTGKAALFRPFERDSVIADVDPRLAAFPNVVGSRTFGQQFNASTTELFAAVRDAVSELASQEGITVTLWANIEAFEFTTTAPCGYGWAYDRTDKDRIDWALTQEAAYPTHIVSFMWDAYYTCRDGGYAQSLHEEILADFDRPIAVDAALTAGGLVVRGFHLAAAGTQFNLTWYDGNWALQSATVTASSATPGWGASHDRSPLLEEVTLPFDSGNLAPSFYVHIRPASPGGALAHHTYSLAY